MKKTTVTVAISAYNEEENIINLLKSVLGQKEKDFTLNEIWVHSDGSTDRTVELANSLSSSRIKVFNRKKRIGKSSRLNEIYDALKTDILVQTDADVVFTHPWVIYFLINPLLKYSKVAMSGGHPKPLKGKTFTEQSINLTFDIYSKLRSELRGGNNKFSVDGRLLAYKKELVKKIQVPSDMIANDFYTYLYCLTEGYDYRYVKKAIVYFRSPANLRDHLKQNIRFESAAARMKKYFPKELVERETYIPRPTLTKHMLAQFLKDPIKAFYILVINQYCRFIAKKREGNLTAIWDIAESTKRVLFMSMFFIYEI